IRVYKSTGFLVDSSAVDVEHIAKSDSGSGTDGQGNLQANPADFTTLAELADDARAEHTREMNEVNVDNLNPSAVRGLFSVSGPAAPMLTMLAAQRRLEAVGHGTLPLFLYDQEHGGLVAWNPTIEDVHELLEKLPQRIKPLYEQG